VTARLLDCTYRATVVALRGFVLVYLLVEVTSSGRNVLQPIPSAGT